MADGTEGKRFYRTLPWWQVPPGGAPGEWVDARGNPASVPVVDPAKYGDDPFTATTSPVPAWMRGDGLSASPLSGLQSRPSPQSGVPFSRRRASDASRKPAGPSGGYLGPRQLPSVDHWSNLRMSTGADVPPGFDSAMLARLASLTSAGELRQSAEDALLSELARQPASISRGLSRATSPYMTSRPASQ